MKDLIYICYRLTKRGLLSYQTVMMEDIPKDFQITADDVFRYSGKGNKCFEEAVMKYLAFHGVKLQDNFMLSVRAEDAAECYSRFLKDEPKRGAAEFTLAMIKTLSPAAADYFCDVEAEAQAIVDEQPPENMRSIDYRVLHGARGERGIEYMG